MTLGYIGQFKKIHFCLRRGWVFLERTWIHSGIQFTTHFIEIFVVQTKRFIGSPLNVILTRQTCSQRSSRAAESIRRALGNHFSERIYYMFLMSKCREDRDLGLCTFWVLAKREALRNAKYRFFLRAKHVFSRKSPLRSCSFFVSTQKVHTPGSSLLYILRLWTYSKFTRKNNCFARSVCNPQPCSSTGRRFAASRSRLQIHQRIVLFAQQKFRWNAL